jgi:Icc-related predicted phosphoesterase
MKLVIISDTHTKHAALKIPECDVLVHCGDFTWTGEFEGVCSFVRWLERQPATHKICIAGNHELTFDKNRSYDLETHQLLTLNTDKSIHYLEDSSITIDGIKFYGTPWTPWFFDWAFNGITDENLAFYRGVSLSEKYSEIPKDVQVLICHGPVYDICDLSEQDDVRTGSVEMRKLISEKLTELQLDLCGHIHEARGMKVVDDVTFVNASSLGRDYETISPPVIIHLDENGQVNSVEGLKR